MTSTAISYPLPLNLHVDRAIRHAGFITYARDAADRYMLFDIAKTFGFSRAWTVKEVNHPEYVRTNLDRHISEMEEAVELARLYEGHDLPFMRESLQMLEPRIEAMREMRDNLATSFEKRVAAVDQYERAAVVNI